MRSTWWNKWLVSASKCLPLSIKVTETKRFGCQCGDGSSSRWKDTRRTKWQIKCEICRHVSSDMGRLIRTSHLETHTQLIPAPGLEQINTIYIQTQVQPSLFCLWCPFWYILSLSLVLKRIRFLSIKCLFLCSLSSDVSCILLLLIYDLHWPYRVKWVSMKLRPHDQLWTHRVKRVFMKLRPHDLHWSIRVKRVFMKLRPIINSSPIV